MKIGMTKKVEVEAETMMIHMKVRDGFCCQIYDQDGEELKDFEGYVPQFMPGEHHGDYLILQIELDTGKILNWETPKAEDIETFINGQNE